MTGEHLLGCLGNSWCGVCACVWWVAREEGCFSVSEISLWKWKYETWENYKHTDLTSDLNYSFQLLYPGLSVWTRFAGLLRQIVSCDGSIVFDNKTQIICIYLYNIELSTVKSCQIISPCLNYVFLSVCVFWLFALCDLYVFVCFSSNPLLPEGIWGRPERGQMWGPLSCVWPMGHRKSLEFSCLYSNTICKKC